MAGVTSRPSRNAGAESTQAALPQASSNEPASSSESVQPGRQRPNRLQTLLTGPEPRWARPLLMFGVASVLLVAIVAALLILAQGVEPRAFDQNASNSSTEKLDVSLIAQSFRSPRNNLSRVDVEGGLTGVVPEDGVARLVLGEDPAGKTLFQVPLSSIAETGGYALSFAFPPIAASEGVTYTVVFETPGKPLSSALSLQYDSFDALSSGRMYLGDAPQAGDLAFSPHYRYDLSTLVSDLLGAVTQDGWLTLCWLLLLTLPGLTLLVCLPNRLNSGQRLLAAPCLGALALPVFYLLLRALNLHIGDIALWVVLLLCAVLLIFKMYMARGQGSIKVGNSPTTSAPRASRRSVKNADLAFWGLFAGVFLVTLISRLLSLRDAFGGAGLDAYHHTLISEMFIQSGGIPANYAPNAPLASFTYHFGFHSLVATIGWLSGRTQAADMLMLMSLAGQVACALPVPALTLFGWRSLGNRWAGLAAGALAGFVSVFPAFYVNWSRYPQGLGLAVLPVAWVLLLEALNFDASGSHGGTKQAVQPATTEAKPSEAQVNPSVATSPVNASNQVSWSDAVRQSGPVMLAVVAAVGLALTHYRIIIIFATFGLLYIAWKLFASLRARRTLTEALTPIWRAAIVGVLSLVALLPWLVNLRQNFTTNFVNRDPAETQPYYDLNLTIGPDLLNHWGLLIMIVLALGGVGWAYRRRDPLPLVPFGVWLLLLLWSTPYGLSDLMSRYWFWIAGLTLMGGWALTTLRRKPIALLPGVALLLLPLVPGLYPFSFRLPYSGYLDTTTLVQGLWLPLSLPAGYTLAELGRWILSLAGTYGGRVPRLWRLVTAGGIGLAVLAGGLVSGLSLAEMLDQKPYIAKADVDALVWMQGHLRRDAYVLANPFAFDWDKPPNQSVHGSDAGLWVPLMAPGVQSSVPPMPAYNERPSNPNYINDLRNIIAFEPFQDRTPDWGRLKAAGVTHIYVGSRGGALYLPKLVNAPEVREVFHEDAVWVFELVQ